jgi:deazaflavin-dependent oxidoreductase (nitroreductase family)
MAKTYQMNAFTRFGNTMSAAMIKLGISPAGLHLLRVRGRKTGLLRTTPVNLIEHQGRRWLVAPYGEVAWVRNVRAAGQAELLRGSTAERIQLREATTEEAVPVLRAYLRQLKLVVGPYFDVSPSSPDAAFVAEAPRHPVFLLTGAVSLGPSPADDHD